MNKLTHEPHFFTKIKPFIYPKNEIFSLNSEHEL